MWFARSTGSLAGVIVGTLYYNAFGSLGTFLANACIPLFWIALTHRFDESLHEVISTGQICTKILTAVREPQIYKAIIFMVLACSTPSYGSSLTYYLEKELNFTATEFGYLRISRRIFAIISLNIYKKYFRHVELRTIFFWSLLSVLIFEQSKFLIIYDVVPIPKFVLALVEGLIMTILGEFILMPLVVLSARICPEGIEGTFYAFIISIQNLSESLAMNGVTHHRRIQCHIHQFSALWKVILVCHFFDIIPIIVVRLLPRKTENTEETTPLKEEIEIPLDTLENPTSTEEKNNI